MKVNTLTCQIRATIVACAALIMGACGSTPSSTPEVTPSVVKSPPTTEVVNTAPDADTLLDNARQSWRTSQDLGSFLSSLDLAIKALIDEQRTVEAKQVLKTRLSLTAPDAPEQLNLHTYLFELFKHDASIPPAQLLALTQPTSNDTTMALQQRQQRAELYQQYGLTLAAANELADTPLITEEFVTSTWLEILDMLPQQTTSSRQRYPRLAPFFDLRDLLTSFDPSSEPLSAALTQFRRVYRGSAIDIHWPLASQNTAPSQVNVAPNMRPSTLDGEQRIAVLLPLSGRLSDTAQDIKAGLLAAYYSRLESLSEAQLPTLTFLDSEALTDEQLASEVAAANWIIGPLQKEYVAKIQALLQPHQYMLALNRVDEIGLGTSTTQNNVAYFSLSPEDEAVQLAEILFNKNLHKPILVASEQAPYPRMQAAFTARWLQLHELANTQNNIDIVTFSDNDSLREGITRALDVEQSKERIQQIRVMVNEELYNVPRSRQDIDAVVVFAGIQETELLNPIIEASLSPFGNAQLPVYASSKSIEYDNSQNQWRDLQDVHFVDIPLLLPGNAWQTYQQQSALLWPEPQPQQQRLFAFGVDAFNLLAELPDLLATRVRSTEGLTGTLSINRFGEFRRWLPVAVIQPSNIKRLNE